MSKKHKFPRGEDRPFFVKFDKIPFKKSEIIYMSGSSSPLIVLKEYRSTKFKRFLIKLGFNIRINQLKVKKYN